MCGATQTCILYLNPGWDVERDGGALRVYYPDDRMPRTGLGAPREPYLDVSPVAGRLIVFDSRRVEHEVRQTYAARWALTLWAGMAMEDG